MAAIFGKFPANFRFPGALTRGPNHDLVDLDFFVVDPFVSWFFLKSLFLISYFFWFPTFLVFTNAALWALWTELV